MSEACFFQVLRPLRTEMQCGLILYRVGIYFSIFFRKFSIVDCNCSFVCKSVDILSHPWMTVE